MPDSQKAGGVCERFADQVKRMSMYVQTKMMRTRSTIPSVMQVVPRDLDDTVPRCFFDFWVDTRLSSALQQVLPARLYVNLLSSCPIDVSSKAFSCSSAFEKCMALSLSWRDI